MCYMERIALTASEEMSFENVDGRTDDGRTPDACTYNKLTYEPSSQVSKKYDWTVQNRNAFAALWRSEPSSHFLWFLV